MQFVKTIVFFKLILFCVSINAQNRNWHEVEVYLPKQNIKSGWVKYKNSSYSNYIKFKSGVNSKNQILNPEEVLKIKFKDESKLEFISINLKGKPNFTNDYYFAKYIVCDELSLLQAKVIYKKCTCNESGVYRNSWFLYDSDSLYFVNTDRRKNIINILEINDLLQKYNYHKLKEESAKLTDLINLLESY
ncbi:MAG: hypothetical protein GX879_10350 [Bacteroidales bacterium]|nr:hypothetical protein [Bacteroidales bacterium]